MANIKLLDLLYESLNSARTNYLNKGRIDRTTFEEFNTIDTSKTKKYIEKMCELFVNKIASKEEIIEAFTEAIPKIERKLVQFDINKLKTLKDFESFKDKIAFADIKNTKEKRKIVVEKGSKQVYKDDRFTILRVDTRDAMKRIGLNTTWCLTYKDDNLNMFYKFSYLYQTSYVIFDNKYPERHPLSKINAQVDIDDSFGEIRTANQTWEGRKNTNVPVEYLEDLGLNINLFEWTEDKLNYYKENYLFTFKDGLTYKIVKDKFSWLLEKDVETDAVTLGYDTSTKKLIWYDGEWRKGTWEDGIWKKGNFYNGMWKGGTFEGQYFHGKWYGGEWKGERFRGEWLDPNNPRPLNIKEYRDGLTLDIIKDKFSWLLEKDVKTINVVLGYDKSTKKLIWYSGTWEKGTWVDGIWKDGNFYGIWKGGIWLADPSNFYGEWKDLNNPKPINVKEYRDGLTYKIVKDKFPWLLKYDVNVNDPVIGYDKKSNKLIWYDGEWKSGTWEDGIWKKGDFRYRAIWKGGIFEGLYFYGKWYGGEWKGKYFWGEWKDPNNSKPINVKKYRNGLTYEIVKDKFPWLLEDDVMTSDVVLGYDKSTKKLIWYDGVWLEGTWVDGIWKKGIFDKKGIWKGGIFEDGEFYGKWYGGEWKGRYFRGEWLDPNNSKPE